MPPAAHAHPVTLDPTSPAFVDGVSCTTCGDDVIVYGGSIADRVWRLHLPTATWTEIPCIGTVPLPRYFHAAAHCNGYLSICGGELIASDAYCHPECVNYFELNLDTFEWSCIDTFGDVPRNRSHHTLTALHGGKELVLFGGKPIPPGVSAVALSNRALTSRQFFDDRRSGFYDVFVLHPVARTWKRVEMFDPMSPLMWGHSASLYNDSHILFFGGCDVAHADWRAVGGTGGGSSAAANSVSAAYASDEPPTAMLSNTVHILALETYQWQQHELAGPADVGPVPRALHVGECCCDELIVFGGFTINRFGGVVTTTDCWMWSVRRGTWQRVEFCVPQWSSKKLLSCIYGTQWLVCPNLDTVFFMEMTKVQLGWQRAASKVQNLLAPPNERSRMVVRPKGPSNGLSPPHLYVPSPSKSVDPYETPFEYRGSSYAAQQSKYSKEDGPKEHHPDDEHQQSDEMIMALREEVRELRAELQSTQHGTSSGVGESGSNTKRLLRWGAYNASTDAATAQQHSRRNAPTAVAPSGTSPASPPKWHRTKSAHDDPKPGATVDAAGASSQPASPSLATSSPPPKTPPAEPVQGRASPTSSSDSMSDLRPRFVDRAVIDKAAKRKVEAFRRLHAKALDRTAKDTEHALRSFSHRSRDATRKEVGAESPDWLMVPPGTPPVESPRHDKLAVQRAVSSDSDENEDIHRVAELGLQLHRALVNNSESKRQLLFRERKRRIQQLQDRLRSLEVGVASGVPTGGRSASGTSGGSPDMKAAVDFVLKHSEAIQRMMDAHDAGEPYRHDASDGSVSAATSMAVLVPNTHEPPESLRSASFSSMTPSEAFEPAEISVTPADGPPPPPAAPASTGLATASAAHQPMALARDDSALSDLTRLDSSASDVLRQREGMSTVDGGPVAAGADYSGGGGKPPIGGASLEGSGASTTPAQPAVVFRGFQRQRSQTTTSAPKETSSTTAAAPPSASRVLKLPPAAATSPASGSSNSNHGMQGETTPRPVVLASSEHQQAAPPTNASLQNQWDVLQAALMSRGAAPRRAFVASDDV